nr:MAG TPA: hypothetical protein [Caudoviricetes sp.]
MVLISFNLAILKQVQHDNFSHENMYMERAENL